MRPIDQFVTEAETNQLADAMRLLKSIEDRCMARKSAGVFVARAAERCDAARNAISTALISLHTWCDQEAADGAAERAVAFAEESVA